MPSPNEKVRLSDGTFVRLTTPRCMFCGKVSEVEVTREEFSRLAHPSRPLIQDCLPDRDVDFRELVKSGVHPACWNAMFGPDPDN